ncbi:MAG: winged helix-turn-helix transcriptional regulator, partial [Lachnospiraceae bacterium]|nr:winged helix-turn-helix transcriptional regulator [Lachnospiraceae bacterium]
MIHIDRSRKESAYLQLYRGLREEIEEGARKAGSRLPSRRSMAEEAGVSVITVDHAYDILQDEGYIVGIPKSGYYVCF